MSNYPGNDRRGRTWPDGPSSTASACPVMDTPGVHSFTPGFRWTNEVTRDILLRGAAADVADRRRRCQGPRTQRCCSRFSSVSSEVPFVLCSEHDGRGPRTGSIDRSISDSLRRRHRRRMWCRRWRSRSSAECDALRVRSYRNSPTTATVCVRYPEADRARASTALRGLMPDSRRYRRGRWP